MARRTKEDAATTRSRLLDAAEQVFYEKGVSRASLGDIALAAGATRGAVYWHFRDKIDLFNAMMDRVTLPMEKACIHPQDGDAENALDCVRAVVQEVLQTVVVNERVRRVFEVAMHKVEYVDEFTSLRQRHLDAVERFCSRIEVDMTRAAQQQNCALSMSAPQAAMGLWALFDGLLQGWILRQGGYDVQALGARAVDAYLRGLGFRVP